MPWPVEQKQNSRERILKSAIRLFSSRGFDGVSIGDVMRDAELTHGGFYAHFKSKQELYAEAIPAAARESFRSKVLPELSGRAMALGLIKHYLTPEHVDQSKPPCPLAFLVTDVANREADVRGAYRKAFKKAATLLDKQMAAEVPDSREKALALLALMVGGVAIAHAVDDEALEKSLLEACSSVGSSLLE